MEAQRRSALDLEPIERTTVTEQVIRSLVDLVLDGHLRPGDRLPSERRLLEQLQVGRTSLREALRTLSLIGLLEARHGSGTYVTSSFSDFLASQLEWSALLGEAELIELAEVRRPLEMQAAAAAARRAGPEEIRRIEEAVARFAATSRDDVQARIDADLMIHYRLAEAAGNRVLHRLMLYMHRLLRSFIEETVRATEEPPEQTAMEHRAILEAIQAGDPERAAEAMGRHMDTSYQDLVEVLSQRHPNRSDRGLSDLRKDAEKEQDRA